MSCSLLEELGILDLEVYSLILSRRGLARHAG